MPDSQNPQSPNYVPGVGRLVTDRFDFQKHVDGTAFRHNATQIDLLPDLVINSVTVTNVQEALQGILGILAVPTVPQATIGTAPSNLGIVTLGGDFSGTGSSALSPKVGGIQGRPIQNIAPSVGQSLAWNGSFWTPTSVQPAGAAGGDLSGSYPNPVVAKLQTFAVSAAAPALNNVLEWTGAQWAPTALPASLPPSGAASGDLSGTYPSPTVAKLQGTPVSAVAPSSGQILEFNGASWIPATNVASGRAYFGSGDDGAAHFDGTSTVLGFVPDATNTYYLTRNLVCTNLQLDLGATIKTNGFIIMCTGILTVNGTIDNSGGPGGTSIASDPGVGAFWTWLGGGSNGGSGLHASGAQSGVSFSAVGTNNNIGLGGQGGTGGNIANLGGALNNPPGLSTLQYRIGQFDLSSWLMSGRIFSAGPTSAVTLLAFGGGTGGGGGASPGGGPPIDGGGGGGGGGLIVIAASILTGSGIIQAKGGNGANTTGWAGGGGGGGGAIVIIYNDKSGWTGLADPAGGLMGVGPMGPGMLGNPGFVEYVQG